MKVLPATQDDAPAIALVRDAAADRLTEVFGKGHWSSHSSVKGVANAIRGSHVLIARLDDQIVGTLTLQKKKPWAIDPKYFAASRRPLYLMSMAVAPEHQGKGIGRQMMAAADAFASELESDAIRLDAYDSPAGAGSFYAKCGYREVGRVTYRGVPLIYYEHPLGAGNAPRRTR